LSDLPTADIQLFNLSADDQILHANFLVIHVDDVAAPSCTAVHIGHFLRHNGEEELAFPSGNYVTTSPFRIETSRLGKPFDEVTREDMASLREKYELDSNTQFSVLLRNSVEKLGESTINSDIAQYAMEYHKHREQDIEQAYLEASAAFQDLQLHPGMPATLYFSPEELPAPAESVMLTRAVADDPTSKAYALVWLLARGSKYQAHLRASDSNATINIQVHCQSDGSFCIGLSKRDPLMLLGADTEFAHFHHVASDLQAAKDMAKRTSELISSKWGVETEVQVLSQPEEPFGTCGGGLEA
jgi:hypothetical protein